MRWNKPKLSNLEKRVQCLMYERNYQRKTKEGRIYCKIRNVENDSSICPYQDLGLFGSVFFKYHVEVKGKLYPLCCRK